MGILKHNGIDGIYRDDKLEKSLKNESGGLKLGTNLLVNRRPVWYAVNYDELTITEQDLIELTNNTRPFIYLNYSKCVLKGSLVYHRPTNNNLSGYYTVFRAQRTGAYQVTAACWV